MNKVYPSLQENEYNSEFNCYARINPEIRRKREIPEIIERGSGNL